MGNAFKSQKTRDDDSKLPEDFEGHGGAIEVGARPGGNRELESNGSSAESNLEVLTENSKTEGLPEELITSLNTHNDELDHSDEESDVMAPMSHENLKESRIAFLKELHGPPITFSLVLDCKDSKTVKEKKLTVKGDLLSQNVHKLKLCIENQYNIPAGCQTVTLDCCTLEDQQLLSYYYLREGDSLKVTYECTGDLTEIMEVIDDLKETYFLLKSLDNELRHGTLEESMLLSIQQKVSTQNVLSICRCYVSHRLGKGVTNHIFFVDCGGLVILRMLHGELLKYPLSHLPLKLQALEAAILSCYWCLTVDTFICKHLRMSRVLQNVLKSFLRVKIDSVGFVKAPASIYNDRKSGARELALKSLGVLCNLAEIPECAVKIASNEVVLNQLVATLSCPSYNHFDHLVSTGGMLCLSFNTSTHPYLSSKPVLSGILKCCTTSNCELLRYFVVILHAILLTTSPHLICTSTRRKCLELDKEFFEKSNYMGIRNKEKNYGFIWKTVIPYMKLAYHAYSHPQRSLVYQGQNVYEMERLDRHCIQCGIFSMSNMLRSADMRDIFLQEGLMDYLVCLPWLYPQDWLERRQAQQLVAFMGQHVQLQPPSLSNITKAKLAAMYFGLEKVLLADVNQLLTEAYA